MIPLKLSLRNFMCYRDNVPPLSFEGIHVACLCGNNGHGKSALLDAITWALWGESRARSDDDLVHLGQTEMEVEFEFAVVREHYRVLRKFVKGSPKRTGQTVLDLQIENNGSFRSISGNAVRETQKRLVDILKMDYQTFINSAFLLQGRADEFTRKRPSERKEILGQILDLSYYDLLEEKAKERSRERDREAGRLGEAILGLKRQLEQRPQPSELLQVQSEVAALGEQLSQADVQLQALRQEEQRLSLTRKQLQELEGRISETRRELDYWDGELKQRQERLQGYENLMVQRQAIEEGYRGYQEAVKAAEEMTRKSSLLVTLQKRQQGLLDAVRRAENEIVAQQRVARNQLQEREAKASRAPQLRQQLDIAQSQLDALQKEEAQLAAKRQQAQEMAAQIGSLESSNKQFRAEMESLKEKLDLLATEEARCPVCESELDAANRERLRLKYHTEGTEKAQAFRANEASLKRERESYRSLEQEIKSAESRLKQAQPAAHARLAALTQALAEAEQASQETDRIKAIIADIQKRLNERDYAPAEQRALSELEQQIASLGYDTEQHRQLQERCQAMAYFQCAKRELAEAEKESPALRAATEKAQQYIESRRMYIGDIEEQQRSLAEAVKGLPHVQDRLARVEKERLELEQRHRAALNRLGALHKTLQLCEQWEAEVEAREKQRQAAAEEVSLYKELAEAFGKKGIQSLVIETVLPEIEEEADRLLSRMTDNRMHLKLESQRETKKGETRETLDIKVSDELGTRDYELFSGGEAFRINFALRIALSRLLARRAGAPLPTLIVDEGFGTQDSTGRERLIEAISAIQDDFEKILVITHIDELKERFPVRIEVTKTEEGSTILIS